MRPTTRVSRSLSPSSIFCSFAFSLEQTNYKDRAEDVAREALEMEKRNPWATHALSEPSSFQLVTLSGDPHLQVM